jgi:hypothetical protein
VKIRDICSLPWMRVEIVPSRGCPIVFAVAVHEGRVVGGAPLGMQMAAAVDYDARKLWKGLAARGAQLMRMDP